MRSGTYLVLNAIPLSRAITLREPETSADSLSASILRDRLGSEKGPNTALKGPLASF